MASRYFAFATKYLKDPANPRSEFVTLGHYQFTPGGHGRYYALEYNGELNRPGFVTTVHHPHHLPGATAPSGPIRIPAYSGVDNDPLTWQMNGGQMKVQVGPVEHEWQRQPDGCWTPTRLAGPGSWTASHLLGFAYETKALVLPLGQKLSRAHLKPSYSGEQWTNANGWSTKLNSGLNVILYQDHGDTQGYFRFNGASSPPMHVFDTILLNYAPHSKFLLYRSGGHDFSQDLAPTLNDFGHTFQLWGVWDGTKVSQMVWIEHSFEFDGRPILSVGRYK